MENLNFETATQLALAPKVLTKAHAAELETLIAESIIEGKDSPADTYVRMKYVIGILEGALKRVKDSATLYYKNHGNTSSFPGVKVDVRSTAGRWDYSSDAEHAEIKAKLKAREELLQTAYNMMLNSNKPLADAETGEIIKPAKYNAGEDSIFITFPAK